MAESVGGEIASGKSAATSEIMTAPIMREAGTTDSMSTKLMRSPQMPYMRATNVA